MADKKSFTDFLAESIEGEVDYEAVGREFPADVSLDQTSSDVDEDGLKDILALLDDFTKDALPAMFGDLSTLATNPNKRFLGEVAEFALRLKAVLRKGDIRSAVDLFMEMSHEVQLLLPPEVFDFVMKHGRPKTEFHYYKPLEIKKLFEGMSPEERAKRIIKAYKYDKLLVIGGNSPFSLDDLVKADMATVKDVKGGKEYKIVMDIALEYNGEFKKQGDVIVVKDKDDLKEAKEPLAITSHSRRIARDMLNDKDLRIAKLAKEIMDLKELPTRIYVDKEVWKKMVDKWHQDKGE